MRQMILTACMLLVLGLSLPAFAEMDHQHQHGTQAATETMPMDMNKTDMGQMDMSKMDASIQQMQDMRKKIEAEKDPAARKELLHQHLQMMKDGMNMMTTMKMNKGCMMMGAMGDKGMMKDKKPCKMMGQNDGAMPMGDQKPTMEKPMAMAEKPMDHGGMMNHGKMMGEGGMTCMMEKKMAMQQEILSGLMLQQEMMMK